MPSINLRRPAISDHIFVIKDGGFAAFAVEGTYDVLAIVDQSVLHLF